MIVRLFYDQLAIKISWIKMMICSTYKKEAASKVIKLRWFPFYTRSDEGEFVLHFLIDELTILWIVFHVRSTQFFDWLTEKLFVTCSQMNVILDVLCRWEKTRFITTCQSFTSIWNRSCLVYSLIGHQSV